MSNGHKLKAYKSHKTVHAEPMTRGDYNAYRSWQLPADEDGADDGYLVIYGKGTDDHYESWSPKKQFDDGYTELVSDWYGRLVIEERDLATKILALESFIDSDGFGVLDEVNQKLLKLQLASMSGYLKMLSARIAVANGTEPKDFF